MPGEKPEQLVTLRDGTSLGLTVIFALSRTVQIWSRIPGTTGDWFYGWMFAVGLALNAWYYAVNVQAFQAMDFVSWTTTAAFSGMWFGLHGVIRSIRQLRGVRFHSYEPGRGIFDRYLSKLSPNHAAILSDLLTAFLLGLVFRVFGSPIQSGWYFAMCFWMLLGHGWIAARDARREQIWIDSQDEASDWSKRIKH